MRTSIITSLTAILAMVLTLTSCDPLSSVEYKIHNMSTDTVTISFYKEIMTSAYHGYTVQENDSTITHYESDSNRVAVLAPGQVLEAHNQWSGLYREEQVIQLWKYIKEITIGDTPLEAQSWNDESRWRLRKTGGGFAQGESRYYNLVIRDK